MLYSVCNVMGRDFFERRLFSRTTRVVGSRSVEGLNILKCPELVAAPFATFPGMSGYTIMP